MITYNVSFYKSVTDTTNTIIDLNRVLFLKDKRAIKLIDNVRNCNNEDRRANKLLLPTFTPVATFLGSHQISNLDVYNGLLQFDIDGKDNPTLTPQEMRNTILNSSLKPYIYYLSLSCSGGGIWGLIRINGTASDYKGHFEAFSKDLKGVGITGDNSCSDISRLRFISYDSSPYYCPQSEIYCNMGHTTVEPCKPRKGQANGYCSNVVAMDIDKEKMDNMIKYIERHHLVLTNNHIDSTKIISSLVNTFGQIGQDYWLIIRSQRANNYDEDKQIKAYNSTWEKYCSGGNIGNYGMGIFYKYYTQAKDKEREALS